MLYSKAKKIKYKTEYQFHFYSYLVFLLFLIVVWAFGKIVQIPIYQLVADPAEIAGLSPVSGLLSQVGILMWCASATICFLTVSLLKSSHVSAKSRIRNFLFGAGLLTLILMLDDAFQLHETIAGTTLSFIPLNVGRDTLQKALEGLIYLIYLGGLSGLLVLYRKTITQTNYLLFAASLVFFALSIFFDVGTPETMLGHYFMEEGFKFLGVGSWLLYFGDLCYRVIKAKFIDH